MHMNLAKLAKQVVTGSLLAAVILGQTADARCFLQVRGEKVLYEDPFTCKVMSNYGNCVDFKTAPVSSDYPVSMLVLRNGKRHAVIRDTQVPCAEVGTLIERDRQMLCSIKVGTMEQLGRTPDGAVMTTGEPLVPATASLGQQGGPKGDPAHGKSAMKSAASVTLDINTAGRPELSPLPVLTSDAKWHILNFRRSGPYLDGADLASKVCSRVLVDFGATDILIGGTLYQGFKCTAVASGSYWANGGTHSYTLPVEVTGSAVIPPAPAQ